MVFEFTDCVGTFFVTMQPAAGQEVGIHDKVAKLNATISKSLESTRGLISKVGSELGKIDSVKQIELEFGLKFEPSANVFGIQIGGGSADFKVKVTIISATAAQEE